MKTLISSIVFFILLVGQAQQLHAQKKKKAIIYTCKIIFQAYKGSEIHLISEIKDSSIVFINPKNFEGKEYKIQDLKYVKINRKNGGLRGFGYGALIGVASGATFGLSAPPPDITGYGAPEGTGSIFYGIMMAIPGGIMGAFVGGHRKKYRIYGKQENFEPIKKELSKYVLKH